VRASAPLPVLVGRQPASERHPVVPWPSGDGHPPVPYDPAMQPAESIMQAYYRRRGEGRVTELFAAALASSPTLMTALAARLHLPDVASYQVETQKQVQDCRIDLEIVGRDEAGEQVWLVWSEHKLRAPFATGHLAKYAGVIDERAAGRPHRLIIIITADAPNRDVTEETATLGVLSLRWDHVTTMVQQAGTALGGGSWRTSTLPADGETERRLLREWIDFVEYDDEMERPVSPLTTEGVEWLERAHDPLETVEHLVEQAFREACDRLGASKVKVREDNWSAIPPTDT
jgi:hypothetical protein